MNTEHDPQEQETKQSTERIDEQMILLEQERDEWKDKYLRAKAEFDNTRKRLETRYATQALQEKRRFLEDILTVVDNLQLALQHAQGESNALQTGVELTLKIFLEKLAAHDVYPIDALGKPFDPERHEAVGQVECADCEPGSVVTIEQPGYTLGQELLRPARVLIAPNSK